VQRRISLLDQIIERVGIFVVQEEEHLGDYAHNKTAEWLGIAPTNKDRVPLLSFAVVGLREASLAYERVALALADCVMREKCVSPDGPELPYPPLSSKDEGGQNKTLFPLHRFDQVHISNTLAAH
jgi:hypothetical protein